MAALRERDINLETDVVVHVVRKFAELNSGERVAGRPKSDAGFRTVALPSVLAVAVREHLDECPLEDVDGLVFQGPKGAPLRRNNFHRSVRPLWTPGSAGRTGVLNGPVMARAAPVPVRLDARGAAKVALPW